MFWGERELKGFGVKGAGGQVSGEGRVDYHVGVGGRRGRERRKLGFRAKCGKRKKRKKNFIKGKSGKKRGKSLGFGFDWVLGLK